MRTRQGRCVGLALGLGLLASGCIGSIGDRGEGTHGDGPDGSGPGSDPTGDCAADDAALGPSPLQRLTRTEYDHAIRDLLGIEGHPAAALPEDDRVGPFESNTKTSVGEHTVALYGGLAEQLSAAADLEALLPCAPADGQAACAAQAIDTLGRRAYRRPLSDDERTRLMGAFDVGLEEDGFETGMRMVLAALLQSPHFLYRIELGVPGPSDEVVGLTAWELATRLSFFLWKSPPDDALLTAAADGALDDAEGLRAQAERLLDDQRADAAVQSFHVQWLGLDSLQTTEKDADLFPAFTPALRDAMRTETELFVTHAFRDDLGVDELFGASYTFANAELAAFYGVEGPEEGFARVELDPEERAGLLTQAGFLASRAGFSQTSPTRRGQLVRDRVLCDVTPPPPPNVNDALPVKAAGDSKKEQLQAHVTDPSCASCHRRMDPIGFGFEHYDPAGAFRSEDGDLPVDATGEVLDAPDDVAGAFDGAIELGRRLGESATVHACVATQWARFGLGREESGQEAKCAFGPAFDFGDEVPTVRALLLRVTELDAFRYRRIPSVEE
jgi:hypothetical protein